MAGDLFPQTRCSENKILIGRILFRLQTTKPTGYTKKKEMETETSRTRTPTTHAGWSNFRWSAIPWTQIQAAETGSAGGRNQEAVTLTLTSNARLRLGTFGYRFARVLRDRLRKEINQRRREPK